MLLITTNLGHVFPSLLGIPSEQIRSQHVNMSIVREQENEDRERKRHQNEIQAIKERSLKEKVQQI